MIGSRSAPTALVAIVAPVGVLLAACGSPGPDDAAPPPSTTTTQRATTQPPPSTDTVPEGAVVDWDHVAAVDLGGGARLVDCEGDAPVVCIRVGDRHAGILERSTFPIDTLPAVTAALPKGERAALEAHANEYLRTFREDRTKGCGPGYRFTPEPVTVVESGDGLIVSYGFSAGPSPDVVAERNQQWAGIRGDDLVLIGYAGYDPGSCVGPSEEGGEGTVADFVALLPRIAPIVQRSPLRAAAGG